MSECKRRIKVVSAAIIRHGKYLITQRTERAVLPLLWEFPGGKVEEGETAAEALQRELGYRLGVEAEVREEISIVEREYAHYIVELHLHLCDIGDVEPQSKTVQDLKWVDSSEFDDFEFTPADEASIHALLFGDEEAIP